jgi:hypothetical protein
MMILKRKEKRATVSASFINLAGNFAKNTHK